MEKKIENLFRIYDKDKNGYIDKDEFIKMLFNYPKEDIEELTKELRNLAPQQKYKEFLKSSKLVLKSQIGSPVKRFNENKKITSFIEKLRRESNIYESGVGKKRNGILPTTVNGTIKFLAEMIFLKYGDDSQKNRMSFDGFKKWIKLHPKILDHIAKWFRPFLWKSFRHSTSGKELLSFHKLKPILETHLLIQKYKAIQKTEVIGKIYDIFLFLFKKKDLNMPFRVIVLKGLEISFKDSKNKIYLTHIFSDYERIKLKIIDPTTYKIWKNYIKQFSNSILDKKYTNLSLIGKGKFSTVHLARNNINKKLYALKIIKKTNLTPNEKKVLINEEKIMKVLTHPNIVQFYESCETHNYHYYILELVKGTDLFDYTLKKGFLSEIETSKIVKKLLEALYQIHASGIIHRDLKPENIMLEINKKKNKVLKVKIIDFGFAIFEEEAKNGLICGTSNFMAPEILKGKNVGVSSDLFSLGVIMYFLISGELPFFSDEEYLVRKKIIEGDFNLEDEFFSNVSEEAKDLIRRLLEKDPEKRISAFEALEHDFIMNRGFLLNKRDFFRKKSDKNEMGAFI